MHKLTVQAQIKKTGAITQHDIHVLCLALVKQLMNTEEYRNVQEIPQQRPHQAYPTIEAIECSNPNARQKEMV